MDGAEYSGSLLILLNEGVGFVNRNMRTIWKKTLNSRIEMPDYCERSVFEALVNALIHRDYLINGSEVHIDIFDDRLIIYSPGGMPDGTKIQERNIDAIPSTRRNPVLADVFHRLGYMERQGSGLNKIKSAYENSVNFHTGMKPEFFSDRVEFTVTLKNLNYIELKSEAKEVKLTELEQRLCEFIQNNPEIIQSEMQTAFGSSRSKVQRTIKRMSDKGILHRGGSRRNGFWKIIK